jgi:hypothetical protein
MNGSLWQGEVPKCSPLPFRRGGVGGGVKYPYNSISRVPVPMPTRCTGASTTSAET